MFAVYCRSQKNASFVQYSIKFDTIEKAIECKEKAELPDYDGCFKVDLHGNLYKYVIKQNNSVYLGIQFGVCEECSKNATIHLYDNCKDVLRINGIRCKDHK